jgi:DNA mismatch repair protein MutS
VAANGGELKNVSCLTIDVREHNNEIIFMHSIVPGVASRSYGIHVAKMAGMPESVVARAESVLSALEQGAPQQSHVAPTRTKSTVPMAHSPEKPQLSLFE